MCSARSASIRSHRGPHVRDRIAAVRSARIRLENRRTFVVRAPGAAESAYIHSARVNGSAHRSAFFDHSTIAAGGELTLEMSAKPNRTSGLSSARSGPGRITGCRAARRAVCNGGEPDVQKCSARNAGRRGPRRPDPLHAGWQRPECNVTALRTTDRHQRERHPQGDRPTKRVRESRDVGGLPPAAGVSEDHAARQVRTQYAAAGDDTLIDGLRGNDSFKTGRWQGYQGTDLQVTLDFGSSRDIRQIAMGFLQDTGSWILMPRRVLVEASDDGRDFRPLGSIQTDIPERESRAVTRDFGRIYPGRPPAATSACASKGMANFPTGTPGPATSPGSLPTKSSCAEERRESCRTSLASC